MAMMPSLRAQSRRRTRGQILPVMAMLIGLLVIVSLFFINTVGFGSIAGKTMNGSLAQAGLAGLQQICTPASSSCTSNYARWELDGPAATGAIRNYVIYTLVGMPEGEPGSNAGFANYFTSTGLTDTLSNNNGTANDTVDGLDIELLMPVQANDGQLPERYFNCDPNASVCNNLFVNGDACSMTSGVIGMYSSLAQACFDQTTIVTRLRLTVVQASLPAVFERTKITGAGTDAP